MNPYGILGGALAFLLAIGGAYGYGRHDGTAIEVAAQARAEAAVTKEREARQLIVDQSNMAGQTQEGARQSSVKEIYHETNTITERPLYRNICVDADGLRILDKAWSIANGEHPSEPASSPGEGATGTAGGGR